MEPLAQRHFSLLVPGSDELLRISPQDIDYIVFIDGDNQHVVDLSALHSEPLMTGRQGVQIAKPIPGQEILTTGVPQKGGVPLVVGGLALAAVGVLVKFGGAKATVTEDSVDYNDKSYNEINYGLMAAGGAMAIGGFVIEAGEQAQQYHGGELSMISSSGPTALAASVKYQLRF